MARFTEQLRQILHRFARTNGLDVTITDVANELGRNRATIHCHVTRLVKLGYLSKETYGRYLITKEGRAALEHRPTSARSYVRCPDCGRKITL
jgi:DNA-binding IclR family transcriptional regulator